MSQGRTRDYYRSEYVSGNTVRKVRPEREPRVYVDGQRVHSREKELRARERAVTMNAPYVVFLAAVSLVCLITCVTYLHIQSEITHTRENVAGLKTQINTLQSQNDALQYSINSNVDAEHIYKVATTKLGMKQATDNQIMTYKSSDNGYTIQYGDIPSK